MILSGLFMLGKQIRLRSRGKQTTWPESTTRERMEARDLYPDLGARAGPESSRRRKYGYECAAVCCKTLGGALGGRRPSWRLVVGEGKFNEN
ncbi:UNVERIFIED_CONTAM: hypothetical protein Slati_3916300 [Sesamum latifolium]|uniref:Uncharacterized protein n=1 Tax=Sesamum latifolium TaxID=2727402 RepID=A0AAW2TNM5_9LAMI